MALGDHQYTLDDDATLSCFFDSRILGDDPTVTYNRDFDLVGNEYWFPLSSDAVDVLYLVVTLHAWTYWRAGNGNDYYCVGGGGVGFVGGTKIIARVDTGTRADTGVRPYELNLSLCQLVTLFSMYSRIRFKSWSSRTICS